MKKIKNIAFGFLLGLPFTNYAQQLKGDDPSDIYIQHQVIKQGDEFLFINGNTNKRSNLAEFDNADKTGAYPSFKMYYPEKKQEIYFFRLRHPLIIEPYTAYELSFSYKAADIRGQGPFLEFAVYDDTRETQVESHKITINENQGEWKQQVFRIETRNKARFARLLMKSNAGGAANVLVNDVKLKQLSLPHFLKPQPQRILTTGAITPATSYTSSENKLPAGKTFYTISINITWKNFSGDIPLKIEWLGDEGTSDVLTTDYFEISNIDGLQSQWDGVEAEWKRSIGLDIDSMSREKQKLFDGTGSGMILFKMDKPANAKFIRISSGKSNISGAFQIVDIVVDAEF